MKNNNNKNILKSSSFTLIELIIVLAIISILVTILIATIKPTEIFKKTRDNKRIADLKNIEKTIDLLYSTYPNFNELNYASTNIVYISLKDDSPTCSSYISQLPSLPPGYQYRCSANPQNIDGTGWIPIPFNNFDIINLANLPIDPINKPPYYYTFVVGGSYEVTALLERNNQEFRVSNSQTRLTPISRGGEGIAGYSFRRQITINNTSNSNNLTDFQVLVTLDTQSLISAGKMRNDCGDIRFTDSDGQTLLNYWIESGCNTASTKIWVKVPSIPANSTKPIYVYYGNSSVVSQSSAANTFIPNSIYAMSGSCTDATNCGYMDNHNEANVVRTYLPNLCTKYVDRIDWGSVCDNSAFTSDVRDYFYSRFRFLFVADISGIYTFGTDNDDANEAMYSPSDRYGVYGNESSSGYPGETVIVSWYGGHAPVGSLTRYTGTFYLNAGQGIWIDDIHNEWRGGEAVRLGIQKPGGSMLIVNTINYPNQIFARKYTSPEPIASVGAEERL